MSVQFTIRPAKETDYEAINTLMKGDHPAYMAHFPALFKPIKGAALRRGTFLNSFEPEEDDWQYFVAEVDGNVVGYMELNIDSDDGSRMRKERKTVIIDEIIVDPAHESSGIGTALLEQAEEWAKSKKIHHMGLHVYSFRDRAKRLYEHLGYTEISTSMEKEIKA